MKSSFNQVRGAVLAIERLRDAAKEVASVSDLRGDQEANKEADDIHAQIYALIARLGVIAMRGEE